MKKSSYYCVDCGIGYDMPDDSYFAACLACGGHLRPECEAKENQDMVNSPAHYMHGGIETIELIKAFLTPEEFRGYLKGTIYAYRDRAPYKGQTESDYAKGKWYFDRLKGD